VLLPPLAFVVQEVLERLIHVGHIPWTTPLQPAFLIGLAFQLPLALAALIIAWLLDSAAQAIGSALASAGPVLFPDLDPVPVRARAVRNPVGLARGYGERAPPLLRRP
jgi:hypothetical protein